MRHKGKKVPDLLNDFEKHFRSLDVDKAYEAELGDQVKEAEDICAQKDHKMDAARKAEKDTKTNKKDLLAILPKGLGIKFYGDAGSWRSFRK